MKKTRTNTNKLLKAIVDGGYSVDFLADAIGMNSALLLRKVMGFDEFSADDCLRIAEKLNLSDNDAQQIFFSEPPVTMVSVDIPDWLDEKIQIIANMNAFMGCTTSEIIEILLLEGLAIESEMYSF